jgi:hypothetical protein
MAWAVLRCGGRVCFGLLPAKCSRRYNLRRSNCQEKNCQNCSSLCCS